MKPADHFFVAATAFFRCVRKWLPGAEQLLFPIFGRTVVAILIFAFGFNTYGVAENANVVSPVITYQYLDAVGEVADVPVISPVITYQYFDLPPNVTYQTQTSPSVGYFFQPDNQVGPVVLSGQVSDVGGTPLPDATVKVSVANSIITQTVSDAGGNYQFPTMAGGVYVLTASHSTHATSARALTLTQNTAHQDFQLSVLPGAPTIVQTSRQPAENYTQVPADPMGSTLRIFDGTQFVEITAENKPATDRMTIVLTHGWKPTISPDPAIMDTPFDEWPKQMATAIRTSGVTDGIANILAWDWRYAAEDPGLDIISGGLFFSGGLRLIPMFAFDRTHDQGVALGEALQDASALGPAYSKDVHFIGHSLGPWVNAAAVNYLHGYRTGNDRQPISTTPWLISRTHMTLLDQAEMASWFRLSNATDGNVYQHTLPQDFTWADNYESSAVSARNLSDAVNVLLQKAPIDQIVAHRRYAVEWYSKSIANPTDADNPLGFAQSLEWYQACGVSASEFPPSTILPGNIFRQSLAASDELALERTSGIESSVSFNVPANQLFQGVNGIVQAVGNVDVQFVDSIQFGFQSVLQGLDSLVNLAQQGVQNVVNIYNSAVIRLSLTTGSLPFSPNMERTERIPVPDGGDPTSTAAMAWLPIQLPENAMVMVFDFQISGDPMDDVIVCGMGDTNLFSLAGKYIPANTITTSRLIDVSQWRGQQIELFFGFMGGTSSNATLTIENIRLYSLQQPQLSISVASGVVSLSWPISTGGGVVETSTTLSPWDWETVPDAPTLSGEHYILTGSWPDEVRFFRLRQ